MDFHRICYTVTAQNEFTYERPCTLSVHVLSLNQMDFDNAE